MWKFRILAFFSVIILSDALLLARERILQQSQNQVPANILQKLRAHGLHVEGTGHGVEQFEEALSSLKTSHGRAEANATLTGENLIEYGSTDQKILIGTNWEFPCRVNKLYRNATSTTWYFNDEQIEPSPRISVNSDGSLRIALLQPLDSGEYKCVVEQGDRREEMVGILRVLERPSQPMSIRADLITGVPAKVKVVWKPGFDGNSAILRYMIEMRTDGAMDLWTDWERVADSIPVEDCCTYLIDNLKPSTTAEFRVLASNRYGDSVPSKASTNVTMPQQPPASAPRNVHASARSANAVMVQWQPPQEEYWSGDILGYVVRYRLAGYSHAWTEKNMTSKDARNAMLDQLITWHEYEVQVAAYNQRGLGVFSKNALVTTNEGLPTQAPRKLRVNVMNSTAVRVTFTPPSQQSIPGVNLGYKVQFWQDGGDKDKFSKQVVVDPEWNEVNVVVDGLDKFGRYNVTALCFTQPGEGPKSQPVEFVTEQDVPGPVAKISVEEVMYNGAVLVWNPPTEPNGIITRYVLRYWNEATPSQKERVELRGSERNYTIDGLTPSTRYSVDVSSTTFKGDGPLQETRFESGVPPDSSVFQTVFNISAPKARSFTVTGLRPFTKYQLRVIAENVKGRSAPSEPTRQFETKQTNPETLAPGLFAEPTSSSSLAISWTPLIAAHWNGQPRGYLIIYKEEEEENWKEVRISSLRASDFTLRDLRPYVTYNVDVFAENLFGRSASSGAVHAKTYEGVPTGSPLSVRATVINAKTIDVEWDALDEEVANGEVLGYQVRVAPEEHLLRKEDSKIIDVPGEHGQSIRVTNLLPFTVYQVFVLAYTIVGRGPENKVPAVVTTSEALPSVPTGVSFSNVMGNNLVIKWTPPEHPNGVIKGYRVSYRRMGGDWTEAPVPNGMYNFLVSVGADGRNTDYQFSVAAENGEGVGPAATVNVHASSVRVPVRNPPAPFRDTQARYSPSEVSISWDDGMPEEIDAPVRFVQIEYEKQKGDGWQAYARKVAGTTNTTTIKGLSPNSNYRFRIRFAGDFAQSAWSAESEWMKTLPTAPQAPPTSVQSSPYDSNSLLLQWNSPPMTTWNAEAIGYHVSYRIYSAQNNNDSSWFTEEISISSDRVDREQYVLAKLSSFHHYIVRMSSFNGEGDSPYSPPVFVYVGYSIPKRNITNLRAEPLSSTSLAVRWDQWRPDESDVISGFKVRYVPLKSVLSPTKVDDELIVVENNTCVLTDLLKFTEYQISITAYNRAGEGAMAQVREKTLEDIPGPVGELRFKDVLLDSALVTWDVPTQPNGVIVAYNVSYYTMKMQENFVNTAQTTTHLNFYPAAKLVEGATYFFSVRAVTNAGKGAETTGNVTIGPSSLGPAAPTAPKLYPGQSSVTLDWNEAGNPRRTIVGHLIQAKRVSNAADSAPASHHRRQRRAADRPQHLLSTWITLKLLEGSANSHQVSYRDLEPSSYYVFRVFSRNEHGVGAPSFESEELYVPASIPDDPFYTTWWFIALVAMATFVVIVVVVACLCITGSSAKYRREKRNSVDSLQLADGNLVAFQHQKQHRVNARSRTDVGRPATTQSWISDRDPPAYGSVLGERESASGGSVVNMYGLATDVIPSTYHHNANHDAMQRLSTLVGRDVRGSAYIVPPQQRGSIDMLNRSDYSRTDSRSVRGADFSMINNSGAGMGLRSMYGALPARPVDTMPPAAMMMDDNFEDDSFDEDDSVVDEF